MREFGIIGKSLGHSFSPAYFHTKWKNEQVSDCRYTVFEIQDIGYFREWISQRPELVGLNVTIPFKQEILPYLDELSPVASEIGAVNCIRKQGSRWVGHNTDGPAFLESLKGFLPDDFSGDALILGTGGASRAVRWALNKRDIPHVLAGRETPISIQNLEELWSTSWKLIVNTTPLGMWPQTDTAPEIPYSSLEASYYLYDLVYNPEKTLFLRLGEQNHSHIKNGLEMLQLQADMSWQFWNQ